MVICQVKAALKTEFSKILDNLLINSPIFCKNRPTFVNLTMYILYIYKGVPDNCRSLQA